jgi:hypothetical protein
MTEPAGRNEGTRLGPTRCVRIEPSVIYCLRFVKLTVIDGESIVEPTVVVGESLVELTVVDGESIVELIVTYQEAGIIGTYCCLFFASLASSSWYRVNRHRHTLRTGHT